MTTLEILAYALIFLSIPFKIIALMHLNNKQLDFSLRQKKYMKFNLICYAFLFPGIILFGYNLVMN